ncbi:MAG: amidohydrolase family protein, partial [Burkholderiaceae bacterium]
EEGESSGASLGGAIARITCDAARIAGIEAGSLSVGSVADVCVFDPAVRWKVVPAALRSQGKHTPFLGYELSGQVKHTIVSGRHAFSR